MWRAAADAYGRTRRGCGRPLSEDDEEIDILHDRLTGEGRPPGTMPTPIGAQVTLLARF